MTTFRITLKEYLDDKLYEDKFILSSPRVLYRSDGEQVWNLRAYGMLPLRILSEFAGFIANLQGVFLFLFLFELEFSTFQYWMKVILYLKLSRNFLIKTSGLISNKE